MKGDKTLAELAQAFRCAPEPDHAMAKPGAGRGGWPVRRGQGRGRRRAPSVDLKALHAKIGELTLENDFLEGALTKAGLLSARR